MTTHDTIAALATAPTPSPRAIVRTSGPNAIRISAELRTSSPLPGMPEEGGGEAIRYAERDSHADAHATAVPASRLTGSRAQRDILRLAHVHADAGLDIPATLLTFPVSRSATGEEVVEYHIPGSPFLVDRLLARLFALGARQAEPGEFTARAFFNGKLDLAACEGVAATIAASNRAELDAARQLLAGELARRLAAPMELLARTLALVEVGIDFSEEDVVAISPVGLVAAIADADAKLASLIEGTARFERLSHEPRIVLAGRPNAGKSTLLNALAGTARAIVSDAAGTTRDALSVPIRLRNGTAKLIDVAGLESNAEDTSPAIAAQMHEAANRAIETADVVIRVIDLSDPRPPIKLPREPHRTVFTKADVQPVAAARERFAVSVPANLGLDALREELDAIAFPASKSEAGSTLALNARHVAEVNAARAALKRGSVASAAPEYAAHELRDALNHLGHILGSVSPDDVLGRIFSSFCIGK